MSKKSIFFSHDTNASQDPKILQMCSVYKAEGYGWFWMLIEKMSEQENYKLPLQGQYTINAYAMRMYCDCNALQKFIKDCVEEFKLFQTDGNYLWSDSLIRRMNYWVNKSEMGKKAADARWHKSKAEYSGNADAMQSQSIGNTNKQNKQYKQNKINNINEQCERNAFAIFEDNFQKLTFETSDKIKDLIKEYSEDKVIWALNLAIEHNKRTLRYVEGILENDKNGIKKNAQPRSKFNDGWED